MGHRSVSRAMASALAFLLAIVLMSSVGVAWSWSSAIHGDHTAKRRPTDQHQKSLVEAIAPIARRHNWQTQDRGQEGNRWFMAAPVKREE